MNILDLVTENNYTSHILQSFCPGRTLRTVCLSDAIRYKNLWILTEAVARQGEEEENDPSLPNYRELVAELITDARNTSCPAALECLDFVLHNRIILFGAEGHLLKDINQHLPEPQPPNFPLLKLLWKHGQHWVFGHHDLIVRIRDYMTAATYEDNCDEIIQACLEVNPKMTHWAAEKCKTIALAEYIFNNCRNQAAIEKHANLIYFNAIQSFNLELMKHISSTRCSNLQPTLAQETTFCRDLLSKTIAKDGNIFTQATKDWKLDKNERLKFVLYMISKPDAAEDVTTTPEIADWFVSMWMGVRDKHIRLSDRKIAELVNRFISDDKREWIRTRYRYAPWDEDFKRLDSLMSNKKRKMEDAGRP